MTPLVNTHWLANRLDDPNTVVLDATLPPVGVTPVVDTRARYAQQHIPGAVFFDIDQLSDPTSGLPHTLPRAEAFASAMSALGISNTMCIVIYEQAAVFSAPRAWWMLRTFGATQVHILDGGLPAWIDAGLPTDSRQVSRPAAAFHAAFHAESMRTYPEVQQLLTQKNAQILDARSAGRFTGTAPEPRPGLSSGHMPGSINVPYTDLLESGRLKDPASLRTLFADKHIDLTRPITTTCGSGVTAAVLKLALEQAGAQNVSLYDGSWAEYAQQPSAIIHKQ